MNSKVDMGTWRSSEVETLPVPEQIDDTFYDSLIDSVMDGYRTFACGDPEHEQRARRIARTIVPWMHIRTHLQTPADVAALVLEKTCLCSQADMESGV